MSTLIMSTSAIQITDAHVQNYALDKSTVPADFVGRVNQRDELMASTLPDFATFRFSTKDWAERDRLTIFRERFGRMIVKLDPEPLTDDPFHCEASVRALPGLGIGSWTVANLRVGRPRELLLDGCDDLLMMIATSGIRIVSQRGREVPLHAGEALLMSSAETATVAYPSPSRLISLRLPRKVLAASLVSDPEDAFMRPLPGNTETLRLLTQYIEGLSDGYQLATPELQRIVVTHVHDLAALVIGATRDATALAEGRSVGAARLGAIKADIIEDLGRHDLTVAAVGARQGVTPRQVQRLFETEGTTFSEFMLGQRLIRAHRMLVNPRFADRAVSVVAYEAGFGDLSYFNRTFRRRYGAAPSDVRAAARRLES
jgi:AraC-like DNA-binding protein